MTATPMAIRQSSSAIMFSREKRRLNMGLFVPAHAPVAAFLGRDVDFARQIDFPALGVVTYRDFAGAGNQLRRAVVARGGAAEAIQPDLDGLEGVDLLLGRFFPGGAGGGCGAVGVFG